jgi:ribose transport system substrate-binding protein
MRRNALRNISRWRWLTLVALLAAGVVAVGCGSSSSEDSTASSPATATGATGGSSDSGGSSDIVAKANEQMKAMYAGTYTLPEGTAPTPVKDKTLWIISIGQSAGAPVDMANGFIAGAKALGWKTRIFDGKFEPNLWLAGVRQAIAAKADGIWLDNLDCTPLLAALKDAKAANIPVVINEGGPCPASEKDLVSYRASYNTKYDSGIVTKGEGTFEELNRAWGAAGAWNIIARTKGKADLINFVETDNASTLNIGQGVEETMALCPSCKILQKITFVGTDLGPGLQEKAQQAILQNPTANAIHGNYDSAITSGIGAAVRGSAKKPLLFGVEGFPANMDLTRQGVQTGGGGLDSPWEGFCGVDEFVHIFADKAPRPCGVGIMAWDKEHHLAPKGQGFTSGLDYKAAYLKSWGVS